MNRPVGEGKLKTTYRVHLESLATQGDAEAAFELSNLPKLPPLGIDIWSYFAELARCRSYAVTGDPLPITYRDIEAWLKMTGRNLDAWELAALLRLDDAWLLSRREDF